MRRLCQRQRASASLYADEQFPLLVVELLLAFGHDILTVQEAGNTGLPDPIELRVLLLDDFNTLE